MVALTTTNQWQNDRVLVLKVKDGEVAKTDTGLLDKRLFVGKNKLHLYLSPIDNLWAFRYEDGMPPEALRTKFTGYKYALTHAKEYFAKRNVEITEIQNADTQSNEG